MANEARITSLLYVRKGNLQYSSLPSSFTAAITGSKGPTPGSITVTTFGTDVDLSELGTPGLVHIRNDDATNYVTVGPYDPAIGRYYPLLKLLPGESYVYRLSSDVEETYPTTGTGTSGTNATLRIKAANDSVVVFVGAFEE